MGGSMPLDVRRQLRVLIVDDNQDASRILRLLLERMGYSVNEASGASEAVDVAGRFDPDCVISDLQMPEVNGYELARRLRQDASHGHALLVAYSAAPDQEAARLAGFDYCLAKPASLETLMRILKDIRMIEKRLDKVEETTRQQGQVVSEVRDLMKDVKNDVREIKDGLQTEVKELKEELRDVKQDIREIKDGMKEGPDPGRSSNDNS